MIHPAAVTALAESRGAEAVGLAVYDAETDSGASVQGDRWFHAASTIKVAILAALFAEIDAGRFAATDLLHVRNRFFSRAGSGVFAVTPGRDGNTAVYRALGETMPLAELARHMIITSSNLATNLLLDLVGVEPAQDTLRALGVAGGIELVRGVEDNKAFDKGLNNRVTANGLVALVRATREHAAFSEESRRMMHEIMAAQEFTSGIPAGIPEGVRKNTEFAHKTGEISTVQHDAGTVTLPGRAPYSLAVLTQWDRSLRKGRRATVAALSGLVYEALTAAPV